MSTTKGTLWLLPVALGNSEWNVYLPAATRQAACSLKFFVVENAKSARAELKRLDHPDPLRDLSIEQLPETPAAADLKRLLQPLERGLDIGLMSEAGCPAIADPGALLVRAAHAAGFTVKPMTGPSSLLLGLMASGLDGQRFAFHGYLPARDPQRSERISELERESARNKQTQIFIETPYRNRAMLATLLTSCKGNTRLCLATDLTLPTEKIATHTISNWKQRPEPDVDKRPTVFLFLAA